MLDFVCQKYLIASCKTLTAYAVTIMSAKCTSATICLLSSQPGPPQALLCSAVAVHVGRGASSQLRQPGQQIWNGALIALLVAGYLRACVD